jgi:hypothetical protein
VPNPGDNKDVSGAEHSCPSCSASLRTGAPLTYVYALGKIEARFPSIGIEKEFAQATGRADTTSLTDRAVLAKVLSDKQNRYLARRLCYVFSIEGVETYILYPRVPEDLDLLLQALRPSPRPIDVDLVIGTIGPLASPEFCNGLAIPIAIFDQVYSFDVDSLVKQVPRPTGIAQKDFGAAAEELFERVSQLADNAGATNEHRALNYLSVRYPAIYATTADAFARNNSLASVDVKPSRLSGARTIVDVIFTYVNRDTDFSEKFFVRVDVTEEFPFLVSKLAPYYDRA